MLVNGKSLQINNHFYVIHHVMNMSGFLIKETPQFITGFRWFSFTSCDSCITKSHLYEKNDEDFQGVNTLVSAVPAVDTEMMRASL